MKKIKFEVPDEKQPGYLRRVMAANKFSTMREEGNITPEYYENLITFLLAYIKEPEDRSEARDALLDASEEDYIELLNAITGKGANPTSPEPSETN